MPVRGLLVSVCRPADGGLDGATARLGLALTLGPRAIVRPRGGGVKERAEEVR
ncbi:MAG: hypothetical protein Q8Q58_11370 [Candidatus Rokubacteria bacterium]|nr:hypothetical protein [Candidatus Rokubacteria bacterium]